jgi:hypothetical protein
MTNRERALTRRRLLAGSAGTTALLGLADPAGASPTDVVDGCRPHPACGGPQGGRCHRVPEYRPS